MRHVFSGAHSVVLWKLVLEVVEEHGVAVEVVDVLPVGDILLGLTCAAVDVETRAVGEPGGGGEEGGGGGGGGGGREREGGRVGWIF